MGKVNIDFTPTKYSADDAPDLVTGAYNQSMDDLKTALDNATAEDSGGGGGDITYPIPIDKGGTGANNAADARANLGIVGATIVDGNMVILGPINNNNGIDLYDAFGQDVVEAASFFVLLGNNLQSFVIPDQQRWSGYEPNNRYVIQDGVLKTEGEDQTEVNVNAIICFHG